MSTDFSEIMSAMASVPDIHIDPNSGATVGGTGKTLGQKYQMEDKVSPSIAKKMKANQELSEQTKSESLSMVDAYREMIGMETSTQVKDRQEQLANNQIADQNNNYLLEKHFNELTGDQEQQHRLYDGRQGVEVLSENIEIDMMDMYVNSINNKNKWRK